MKTLICDCVFIESITTRQRVRTTNPECQIHGKNVDPHKTKTQPSLTFNPFANLGAQFKAKQ